MAGLTGLCEVLRRLLAGPGLLDLQNRTCLGSQAMCLHAVLLRQGSSVWQQRLCSTMRLGKVPRILEALPKVKGAWPRLAGCYTGQDGASSQHSGGVWGAVSPGQAGVDCQVVGGMSRLPDLSQRLRTHTSKDEGPNSILNSAPGPSLSEQSSLGAGRGPAA